MERRVFIGTLVGGLLAVPLAAGAQQIGEVYRLVTAFLDSAPPSSYASQIEVLQRPHRVPMGLRLDA